MEAFTTKAGQLVFKDQSQLEANFEKGQAYGPARLTLNHGHFATNKSYLLGNFNHGCFNGLFKGYEYVPVDGLVGDPSFQDPVMSYMAFYENGLAKGPIWKLIFSNDGILTGYFYMDEAPSNQKYNSMLDIP